MGTTGPVHARVTHWQIRRCLDPKEPLTDVEVERVWGSFGIRFLTSHNDDEWDEAVEHRLWIHGFALTDADRAEGRLGNFARARREQDASTGQWRIPLEKLDVPVHQHPQRRHETKGASPNWGHPFLRRVRKRGQRWPTAGTVRREFAELRKEYPTATSPLEDGLRVSVFDGRATPRVQPFVLRILEHPDGSVEVTHQMARAAPGRFARIAQIDHRELLADMIADLLDPPVVTTLLPIEAWFRLGGWMVVAVDPGRSLWAYLDVPDHPDDPEVWRGIVNDGDDLPEDWEPTGVALSAFRPHAS